MGFEYRFKFTDPEWYPANRDRIAERIRAIARLKEVVPPDEFRLRDDDIENSWPYDLRVFLHPSNLEVEVSSTTSTFYVDLRAVLEWIREHTKAELVDDDDIPVPL